MAKHRTFKPEFKARVVLQVLTGTKIAAQVCRQHQLSEQLKNDYPISLLCDLLTVSRSSFYYQPAEADESELREAINQLAAQVPTYGSRRLAAQFRHASPIWGC